jgi:hypothetical protein
VYSAIADEAPDSRMNVVRSPHGEIVLQRKVGRYQRTAASSAAEISSIGSNIFTSR